MKNTAVLIDANIVLDVLGKREPFYESSNNVLLCCASKKITGYIALHSISNIFYILRKQYSAEDRRRLIRGFSTETLPLMGSIQIHSFLVGI